MKTASAWSTSDNTEAAVGGVYDKVRRELDGAPDWLVVYTSVKHDCELVMNALRRLAPGVPVHGGTSCLGVMTEEGLHTAGGTGLGVFGLKDPEGRYGVGAAENCDDPRAAGADAMRKALAASGVPGRTPAMIWLTSAPGTEEDVLKGIEEVAGSRVPIAGGSSADNTIAGEWKQFTHEKVYSGGVVVTALFPSTRIHSCFRSGYYPTEHSGIVTGASGRTLHTIDNRPAAEVYNAWTGGAIKEFMSGGNVLGVTSLHPLGRPQEIAAMTFYRLSHPETVTAEGGLTLFTNVEAGEKIVLMSGSRASLVARSGVVAGYALEKDGISPERVAGALVIFCAGCMLTLQDEMERAVARIRESLGGNPFLGAFTFGEQGCLVDNTNYHGNLMTSVIVFERD
ncbi:MAG: FIST C-terminal domain-containing protein [Anaerolineae bacterium]|nr:FIST C-terminal domain-containing protein [Anaerolineae bacterium]